MPDGVFCVLQADMCRDIVFSIRTFKSLRFVQGDRGFVVDVYQKRHAVRPVFLNRCRQKCAAKVAPAALFADEQVIRLIFRAVVGQVDISAASPASSASRTRKTSGAASTFSPVQ